ncbi:flagellar biosynthetic protein FliR [Shewanella sairae]|uniref:Flagellar biosynthetic protein FliR n=1 Tax=Shewanella sairae TaxID=190310 RepID=A0ABQ4PPU6_9GAMM|nr:flagellar biosynthetic protein FliR [Shewanella sairae]MCL1131441.1 flagellar type III secretion system protein FliR [Shewanella sairae]GIU50644.1 flagellar biosynthetic protein FliR [Shewanella sairae]
MEILLGTIMDGIAGYLWPLTRISSMFMVMAVFGANTTPTRVRLLLSVTVTAAVAPVLPAMPSLDLFSLTAAFVTAQQIVIGAAMGFATLLLMQTFVLTGQIIGMQTSLGFASMVDPSSGQQTPVISNFFLLLTTMIFLAVDGHLLMIKMVISSFDSIPVSIQGLSLTSYRLFTEFVGYMFTAALTMSLSAIVALLTINLAFGVMTRASPQLNIFAVGFPVTMVAGLFILWLTLSPIMAHFDEVWREVQILLCDVLALQCKIDGGLD